MFKLLIVEDEKAIRNGIATYFPWGNLGIEVAGACGDGEEAMEFVKSREVDLILCDIRMPRMDGLAFTERVRELGLECVIVLISAHKDFEYARRAIELGVRHFIVKPAGYDALNAVFSKLAAELSAREKERKERDMAVQEDASLKGFEATVSEYVDRNLPAATLASVSRAFGMSANYFSTLFHKRTGTTFSEFLGERRLARAKTLLETTDERVYRIGESVGYSNPKSFMRAFRDRYGLTPNGARKAANGEA